MGLGAGDGYRQFYHGGTEDSRGRGGLCFVAGADFLIRPRETVEFSGLIRKMSERLIQYYCLVRKRKRPLHDFLYGGLILSTAKRIAHSSYLL